MSPSTNQKLDPSRAQNEAVVPCTKNSFILCEICDVFTYDLPQLQRHMKEAHAVSMTKLKYPPISCMFCSGKFFSDEGLERHLLCAHSLIGGGITELKLRNKDSGRCVLCGIYFTSNLVEHVRCRHLILMTKVELGYECKICDETFSLYRIYEKHFLHVHLRVGHLRLVTLKS